MYLHELHVIYVYVYIHPRLFQILDRCVSRSSIDMIRTKPGVFFEKIFSLHLWGFWYSIVKTNPSTTPIHSAFLRYGGVALPPPPRHNPASSTILTNNFPKEKYIHVQQRRSKSGLPDPDVTKELASSCITQHSERHLNSWLHRNYRQICIICRLDAWALLF